MSRFLLILGMVAVSGCAMFRAREKHTLILSHVAKFTWHQPPTELYPRMAEFVEGQGLKVRRDPGSHYIETEWLTFQEHSKVIAGCVRYAFKIVPLDQGRSTIRVSRVSRTLPGVNRKVIASGGPASTGVVDPAGAEEQRISQAAPPGGEGSFAVVAAKTQQWGCNSRGDLQESERPEQYADAVRDLEMEWLLLQELDPAAADEIERIAAMEFGEPVRPYVARKAATQAPEGPKEKPAPARTDLDCGEVVAGLERLLEPKTLLMLGEMHGTREAPLFLTRAACFALKKGLPVRVGIEHPIDEQARTAAYVAGSLSRTGLLSQGAWRRAHQDGRTSEAMLEVLEWLRAAKAAGRDVEVFTFDAPLLTGNPREEAMAAVLETMAKANPSAVVLALTGNVHARVHPGVEWDLELQPAAWRLQRAGLTVIALDQAYGTGLAWMCALDNQRLACGARMVKGKYQGASPFVYRMKNYAMNPYNGFYYVGSVTASPPAIRRERRSQADTMTAAGE